MNVERVDDLPHPDGSEGVIAIVVTGRCWYESTWGEPYGTHFLTDPSAALQAAVIHRPEGYVVPPHAHHPADRSYRQVTQEVLVVRRGSVRLDVFTRHGARLRSFVLGPGDFAVLLGGGHALTWIVEGELVEVKSGPYRGRERDKYDLKTEG